MNPRTWWNSAWFVFALSMIVCAGFWLMLPAETRMDRSTDFVQSYEPVARSILAGNGVRNSDGTLATFYPPGYSLILAFLFGAAHVLDLPENLVLQVFAFAAHALTAVFVFHIAADVWGRRWALLAAGLWMTYLPALWFLSVLNSETAFTPVFFAAMWVFWRQLRKDELSWSGCMLAGVLMGAAMMIRPIAIAGTVILAAILLRHHREALSRKGYVPLAMLLVGTMLVVTPWQVFAYARAGKVLLLSSGGPACMIGGLTYALPYEDRPTIDVPQDVKSLMDDVRKANDVGELRTEGQTFGWVGRQFVQRPVTVGKLFVMKAARAFYGTDSHRREGLILILQAPYLLAGLLGAILAWRRYGASALLAGVSIVFLLYFWAMTTVVLSIARYMVPAMPLLFLLIPAVFHANLHKREYSSKPDVDAGHDTAWLRG